MLVDVAIIDYCTSEIIMLKADDDIIVRDFQNNVPAYIEAPVEQGGLGYDLKDCDWMIAKRINLYCPSGGPLGGIEIGPVVSD